MVMTMVLRRTLAALALLAAPLLSPMAMAEPIATNAKHLYIVDYQTGSVLYDKLGEERLGPASMSKLMTVYMLFDALKRGDVKLTDTFHVSQKAWAMQGSKMFVDIDSDVKVEDLIRGILIQSGNDACIVVAEGLAGSEDRQPRPVGGDRVIARHERHIGDSERAHRFGKRARREAEPRRQERSRRVSREVAP